MIKRLYVTLPAFLLLCAILWTALWMFCRESSVVPASSSPIWKDRGTVIVDPGHGGFDGGASSDDGRIQEKDLNLQISQLLENYLLRLGYNVVMTRETDTALGQRKRDDTAARVVFSKEYPDAVYISVHCNKFTDPRYGGFQAFFPAGDEKSHQLADLIHSTVKELVLKDNTRVALAGSSSIYLMKHTKVTTVIVECGFLSNSRDLAILTAERSQKLLADAIATGIDTYMRTLKNVEGTDGE